MNISPIKSLNEAKSYPSPISKKCSPLSTIQNFQTATLNVSSRNFDQWYSSAMSLIKLFDIPSSHELDSAAPVLRTLPLLLLESSKKTFVTEAFKCTSAVILNLLAKSNLIEEHLKDQVRDFLASIFQHFPLTQQFHTFNDEIKESEGTVSEIKKPYSLDSFLEICKIQNDKNLCVSLCDEFGRFGNSFFQFVP